MRRCVIAFAIVIVQVLQPTKYFSDGRKISEGKLDRNTTSFMLKNYNAGVYFIQLSGATSIHTHQFIIVK